MQQIFRSLFIRAPWLLLLTALMAVGVRAQELPSSKSHMALFPGDVVAIANAPDPLPEAAAWEQLLKRVANDLIGIRYRLGGSSAIVGLDCSGLIKQIWLRMGLADLPHKASDMAKLGVPVQLRDIQVGDLVFFNTTGKQNSHVGVYIGEGRFVHASSVLKKVTENSLSERYYQKTFNGIRRVAGVESIAGARSLSD